MKTALAAGAPSGISVSAAMRLCRPQHLHQRRLPRYAWYAMVAQAIKDFPDDIAKAIGQIPMQRIASVS